MGRRGPSATLIARLSPGSVQYRRERRTGSPGPSIVRTVSGSPGTRTDPRRLSRRIPVGLDADEEVPAPRRDRPAEGDGRGVDLRPDVECDHLTGVPTLRIRGRHERRRRDPLRPVVPLAEDQPSERRMRARQRPVLVGHDRGDPGWDGEQPPVAAPFGDEPRRPHREPRTEGDVECLRSRTSQPGQSGLRGDRHVCLGELDQEIKPTTPEEGHLDAVIGREERVDRREGCGPRRPRRSPRTALRGSPTEG